jgi:serine/threonine-protein kinase
VLYEMLVGDVPFRGENQVAVAMKHVREEVPDVQRMRPEVSAALAAVVDRATAKDLDRRYLDAASLVADLEEVLAIETARAGGATGEATTVLRTLPGPARKRLPLRLRIKPAVALALVIVAIAAVAAILVLAGGNTHRGTRPPSAKAAAGLVPFNLGQNAAHDYDPLGTGGEHPDRVSAAIDDDPNSAWSTETYDGGQLGKAGVGLYVDARPGVIAKRMDIRTSTPGWSATIYAAQTGPPAKVGPGWTAVGRIVHAQGSTKVRLTTDQAYRYYLIWITQLPPQGDHAAISDLALFRQTR